VDATRNMVVQSINMAGDCRCVDVFRRPDGSFGFAEFRRDPEDNRGWFPVVQDTGVAFLTAADALVAARRRVVWLAEHRL
jgi:hypothetical protein